MKASPKRLPATTSETQVFFYATQRADGEAGYIYVLDEIGRKAELDKAMAAGHIPDHALVLAAGVGKPDEKTRFNMELYFGYRTEEDEQLAA